MLAVFVFGYKAGKNSVLVDWQAATLVAQKDINKRLAAAADAENEYKDALEALQNVKPENNGDVAPVLRDTISRLR